MQHTWFHEVHTPSGLTTSFQIERMLCRHKSPFQDIIIFETSHFGRMMVLDGCIMLTERDEFLYHEMLTHPAVCSHPAPKRALVVGGGDGGTVRELLRHSGIEAIDLVELDEAVVRLSQEHIPSVSSGLTDQRVTLHFEDGVAFMQRHLNTYDIILIDSTDPVGPAEGLITEDFYGSCQAALKEDGVLALQSESPFLHPSEIKKIFGNLRSHFATQMLYNAPVIAYPSGWWSFAWASNQLHPLQDFQEKRAKTVSTQLQYYNAEIHKGSFALPNFVKKLTMPEDI